MSSLNSFMDFNKILLIYLEICFFFAKCTLELIGMVYDFLKAMKDIDFLFHTFTLKCRKSFLLLCSHEFIVNHMFLIDCRIVLIYFYLS